MRKSSDLTKYITYLGETVATRVLEKSYEVKIWITGKRKDRHFESSLKALRRRGFRNSTIKFPGGIAVGISARMRKRGRWDLDDIKVCKKPPHHRKKRTHYTQVR